MNPDAAGRVEPRDPHGSSDDHDSDNDRDSDNDAAGDLSLPPAGARPPRTGDADLDPALDELAEAQQHTFAERIDSGERVHRLMQRRLSDLGQA